MRSRELCCSGCDCTEILHKNAGAHELLLGIAEDGVFGPVILFGQGGTAVEVIRDRVVGLPPLNALLARDMIERTRVFRLLKGYRDRPAADLDAVALTLVKLSHLVADLDRVAELDINPLLGDADGVVALDARVVVHPREKGRRPFAIRPYPRELEREIETRSGGRFLLRPIRPEDEAGIIHLLTHSSPNDVRLRFFAPIKEFGHAFAARLTQIDYDREMAFVAVDPATNELSGVVRIISDPDIDKAEFAVTVRSDLQGAGLGYSLMTSILDYSRLRSVRRVVGDVLGENTTMLKMAKELGFKVAARDPSGVVTIELDLARQAPMPEPG